MEVEAWPTVSLYGSVSAASSVRVDSSSIMSWGLYIDGEIYQPAPPSAQDMKIGLLQGKATSTSVRRRSPSVNVTFERMLCKGGM